MIAFFGILRPGFATRAPAPEAPYKANFFGGAAEADAPCKAEEDALFLAGKRPEPGEAPEDEAERARFVHLGLPPCF